MGAMTRLDAVNQCLLAAGEAIVSDLENQTGIDTSIAEYLLNQYTDDFQFRGLANNRYTKTLTIDPVTFKVALPMTIISLDFNTALYNADSQLVRVSVRKEGSAFVLWNVTDQTTNFSAYTEELSATLIVSVEWEDIDTPGQRAIVASAARRYQMLTQGDASMDQYLAQDEMIYNMKGKSRDIESKRRTIWDSASPQTKRAVFRQSGSTAPDFRRWRGRIN